MPIPMTEPMTGHAIIRRPEFMRYLLFLAALASLPQEPAQPSERIVAAFYRAAWDAESGEGLTRSAGGDALQDHPESFKDFSYRKVSWHRRNLEEMGQAGLDVALCEFADNGEAVKALVQALEESSKEFRRVPRVAPAVRDPGVASGFLKAVPKSHRAAVAGRDLVWLFPAKSPDLRAMEALEVYKVGDAAWKPDLEAVTGGAFDGPRDMKAVTLGPGFKDGGSRIRGRDEGLWYDRSWYAAMRIKPRLVAIESWNRFDEGSTICPTKEFEKGLLAKTLKYADLFRRGDEIERPKGKYYSAIGVSYHLKFEPPHEGLRPVDSPASPFEVVSLAGQTLLRAKAVPGQ